MLRRTRTLCPRMTFGLLGRDLSRNRALFHLAVEDVLSRSSRDRDLEPVMADAEVDDLAFRVDGFLNVYQLAAVREMP